MPVFILMVKGLEIIFKNSEGVVILRLVFQLDQTRI